MRWSCLLVLPLVGCVQIIGIDDVLPLEEGAGGAGGVPDLGGTGGIGATNGAGGEGGAPPTCDNGTTDGDETDLDCGGSCAPCVPSKHCLVPADCDSGVCDAEICQEPSCDDALANGGETDVDCGGLCQQNCKFGQGCMAEGDCGAAAHCEQQVCLPEPLGQWTMGDPFPVGKHYIGDYAMGFDQTAGLVLVYGGFYNGGDPFDNWLDATRSYAGDGWTLESSGIPSKRNFATMVWDAPRSTMVMFGGSGPAIDNKVWERPSATGTWVDASGGGARPSVRGGPQMAFDTNRNVTVLYGGGCNSDTWEWDGDAWTARTDVEGAPGIRYAGGAVYDEQRGVTVMFGGTNCADPNFRYGDTWEWDGDGEWTLVATDGPVARSVFGMAYDTHRGRTVLYGGNRFDVFGSSETWSWDGSSWQLVQTVGGPGEDYRGRLAYDSARRRFVYVRATGPAGQTWELSMLAIPCSNDTDCGTGHCEDALCCDRSCLDGEACNTEASPGVCTLE